MNRQTRQFVAHRRRAIAWLLAVIICGTVLGSILGRPSAAADPTSRVPVPAAEQLAKARETVKELYSSDFTAAKTPLQKSMLAERLLKQGLETKDDPAGRYALLDTARRVAEQSGNLDLCLRACNQLGNSFEVKTFPLKEAAIESLDKQAKRAGEWQYLAEVSLAMVDEAIEADDYAGGQRLIVAAQDYAKKSRVKELNARATNRAKQVTDIAKAHVEVLGALEALRADPKDAASHLAVGKFLCFSKGSWKEGLAHLVQGKDEPLAKLAQKDLAGALKPDTWIELGDAWVARALTANPREKEEQGRRAVYWYRHALPTLSGLSKTRIEKTLKELPATYNALAGIWNLSYANGVKRTYQIDGRGNVVNLETKEATILANRGADTVLEFKDGKLERLRVIGGELAVEHFNPASHYPSTPDQTARGVRTGP